MNTSQFEVTLIDSMGSDLAVVNAARVSLINNLNMKQSRLVMMKIVILENLILLNV